MRRCVGSKAASSARHTDGSYPGSTRGAVSIAHKRWWWSASERQRWGPTRREPDSRQRLNEAYHADFREYYADLTYSLRYKAR
jgi:hypothetical protein